MKQEEGYDYFKWKAAQEEDVFEVVCDNGDTHLIKAHEIQIDAQQPNLKLVIYKNVMIDTVIITGGSKNKTEEMEQREVPVASVVGAFLAGEWSSVVNVSKRDDITRKVVEAVV